MKTLANILLLILIPMFVCTAWGNPPELFDDNGKPTSHIRANEAYDNRDGGETIETAIEIELPFFDTGATCDNIDDYDEVCPYDGSTAPDVVYTYLPQEDITVSIDLCGSLYDTKVYVYDEDMNYVACNDDFYGDDECGMYVSLIEEVFLQAGIRYYIVVDGYGSDCGEYSLLVAMYCIPPPCLDAECPADGMLENEPPLVQDYVDVFNGGCDSAQPVFQELVMPAGQDELNFCGNTGYFTVDSNWQRDSDWFVMVADGDNIHVETNSSHFLPTDCDVLFLEDCNNVSLLPYQMGICDSGTIDIPTSPGDIVYLRVRPTLESRPDCVVGEDLYTLKIQGIGPAVVAV